MDGGAWWAAVHGVANSQTRLHNFTFTFHFPALEKEMETHSSVLSWRIPGTGKPAGLPSMGSHRVGHDWSDLAAAAAAGELRCRMLQSVTRKKKMVVIMHFYKISLSIFIKSYNQQSLIRLIFGYILKLNAFHKLSHWSILQKIDWKIWKPFLRKIF